MITFVVKMLTGIMLIVWFFVGTMIALAASAELEPGWFWLVWAQTVFGPPIAIAIIGNFVRWIWRNGPDPSEPKEAPIKRRRPASA